jgi:hypothetical protein
MTPPVRRHLLVVGAQRCGTTYLAEVLDRHPAITMAWPARPEPKVFVSAELSARGRDWYVGTWFAQARDEVVLGDKSTSYLEDPAAAGRAAAMLGTAEVVVQLRDPVARAVSNWRFSTDNGLETLPLDEALEWDLRGGRPWDAARTSVSPYAYVRRGRYADYLPPWREAFPGHVHVTFLEETTASPEPVAALYRALGLDPAPATVTGPVNASTAEDAGVDAGLLARLRDFYAEADDQLVRLLGRPLPWPTAAAPTGRP